MNKTLTFEAPNDENAEKQLLGIFLLDNRRAIDIPLTASYEKYFFFAKNKKVFKAMQEVLESGKSADLVSVSAALARSHVDVSVSYLAELVDHADTAKLYTALDRIKEAYTRRKLIGLSSRITNALYDAKLDLTSIIALAQHDLSEALLELRRERVSKATVRG